MTLAMKKKKRKKPNKTLNPKAPLSIKEAEEKIKSIRAKLQDLKEYKAILREDGLKPDEEDKRRESELIVRLLRLEKQAGVTKEKEVPWRGKGEAKSGPGKSSSSKDAHPKSKHRRTSKDSTAKSEKPTSDGKKSTSKTKKFDRDSPGQKKKVNRGSKASAENKPGGARAPKSTSSSKKAGRKPSRRNPK